MKGVDPSLRPQLMTEIGDIRHFSHRSVLTAFARIALALTVKKSVRTPKRGSAQLRKSLV